MLSFRRGAAAVVVLVALVVSFLVLPEADAQAGQVRFSRDQFIEDATGFPCTANGTITDSANELFNKSYCRPVGFTPFGDVELCKQASEQFGVEYAYSPSLDQCLVGLFNADATACQAPSILVPDSIRAQSGTPVGVAACGLLMLAPKCGGLVPTIDMNIAGVSGTGTAGNDVILGTPSADAISGLGGDDIICAEAGNDSVNGGAGRDRIWGGDGDDQLIGGADNDSIRGQTGTDQISGNDGNDFLYGGTGNDVINGNDGNDTIGGFGGADTIDAGPGNDIVFGGFGGDTIHGGSGRDELRGLIGNDIINGDAGNDKIFGDAGQDTLRGGDGNDVINGGNSIDRLSGDAGDDTLAGGKANDTLDGGADNDSCAGNLGSDSAVNCETVFGVP